jgi:hypothetical protein
MPIVIKLYVVCDPKEANNIYLYYNKINIGYSFSSTNSDCIYIHFTSSSNVLVLILHVRRSAEFYPYTIVDCRFSTIVLFYGFGYICKLCQQMKFLMVEEIT